MMVRKKKGPYTAGVDEVPEDIEPMPPTQRSVNMTIKDRISAIEKLNPENTVAYQVACALALSEALCDLVLVKHDRGEGVLGMAAAIRDLVTALADGAKNHKIEKQDPELVELVKNSALEILKGELE